jgi:hypothetical protein
MEIVIVQKTMFRTRGKNSLLQEFNRVHQESFLEVKKMSKLRDQQLTLWDSILLEVMSPHAALYTPEGSSALLLQVLHAFRGLPVCKEGHSCRYDSFDTKYETLKYTQPKGLYRCCSKTTRFLILHHISQINSRYSCMQSYSFQ